MPTIGWTFGLDGTSHTVELDHAWILGIRTIRVDGRTIERMSTIRHALLDRGSNHPFQIGPHQCRVCIWSNWAGLFRYGLNVDGRTLAPSTPLPSQTLMVLYTLTVAFFVGMFLVAVLNLVLVSLQR
jgi:hypothetical protein